MATTKRKGRVRGRGRRRTQTSVKPWRLRIGTLALVTWVGTITSVTSLVFGTTAWLVDEHERNDVRQLTALTSIWDALSEDTYRASLAKDDVWLATHPDPAERLPK